MARSHPGLRLLTNYLRIDFPWKKDYVCVTKEINQIFSYEDVKEALVKLKTTDPTLHRLLTYRYMTNRSRSDIAQSLYMDSSTLKRQFKNIPTGCPIK
jgi:AraC-like DNA-binding protein